MAKTLLVECYEPDGGSYAFRMTVDDWEKLIPMVGPALRKDGALGPCFYIAWKTRRRWDGARLRKMHEAIVPSGLSVIWKSTRSECGGRRWFPVLEPQ
jgi:hypothetical protein